MNQPAKKVSRREILRQIAAENAATDTAKLPDGLEEMLCEYRPMGVDDADWERAQPVVIETMRASHIRGRDSFQKHLGVVARYLLWRVEQGKHIEFPSVFTQADVDAYYLNGINASDKTRNDYRSRLSNICRGVNPSPDAVLRGPASQYRTVRPGFTDDEMKDIRRVVSRQKTPTLRRQLSAIVGLCAGAGLSATDLRHLIVDRIVDHGDDGIEVRVPGAAARVVWVRTGPLRGSHLTTASGRTPPLRTSTAARTKCSDSSGSTSSTPS